MIPKYSNMLFQEGDLWDKDGFVVQANISHDFHSGWHIHIPKDITTVARTPDAQQQAQGCNIFLPNAADIRSSANRKTSLLSASVLLGVTTKECDQIRYLTLHSAADGLTTPSRLCNETPEETIIRAGNEQAGLFFRMDKDAPLHRVSFGENKRWVYDRIDMAQHATLQINAERFYNDARLDFRAPVTRVQAQPIERSPLYTKIHLEVEEACGIISTSEFSALTHMQRDLAGNAVNTLNIARIYHINLPCSRSMVYAIDPVRPEYKASLCSVKKLQRTGALLSSFHRNFCKAENKLQQKRDAWNNLSL